MVAQTVVGILCLLIIVLIVSFIVGCIRDIILEYKKSKWAKCIKPGDKFHYTWSKNFEDPFEPIKVDEYEIIDVKTNDNGAVWVKYKIVTFSETGVIIKVKGINPDCPVIVTDYAASLIDMTYNAEIQRKLNKDIFEILKKRSILKV